MAVLRPYSFRSLVGVAALIVLAFAALCAMFVKQGYDEARDNANLAASNILHTMSRDVQRNIEVSDLELQAAARLVARPEFASFPADLRQALVSDVAAQSQALGGLIVLDDTGRVMAHVVPGAATAADTPEDLARHRVIFDYHREHPDDLTLHLTPPPPSGVAGDAGLALSRVRLDPAGRFAGVVLCSIDIGYFRAMFDAVDLGPHAVLSLIDERQVMIMRKPFERSAIGHVRSATIVPRAMRGETGPTWDVSPVDGLEREYVYTKLGLVPMVILIGTSDRDIFQTWYNRATAFSAILLTLLSAGAFVLWLLSQEIGRRADAERLSGESEARFRLLAERSSDAITLRDATGRRQYASPSFYQVVGWTPEALGGRSLMELSHPDDQAVQAQTMSRLATGEETVAEVFRLRRQDGSWAWLEGRVSATYDSRGAVVNLISNLRDVTAQKAAEEELAAAAARFEAMAATDKLTGLANRRRFDERLDEEWRRAARDGSSVALLLLDADDFKGYNDRYGHQRGDAMLQAIATCILEGVRRPSDLGARYGGEEFAVLLPETSEAQALMLGQRIREQVAALRFPHAGSPMGHVTVSVGAASLRPHEMLGPDALVADADAALYCAKRQGKDRCIGMTEARLSPGPGQGDGVDPVDGAAPAPPEAAYISPSGAHGDRALVPEGQDARGEPTQNGATPLRSISAAA